MKGSSGFANNHLHRGGAYVLMLFLFLGAFMAGLPQEATAAWSKRVIGTGVVRDTSIRVDSNGHVHMSFVKGGCLFYMHNKTGKWVKTAVDNSKDVGFFTSIAVDGSGKVHISYYDATRTALKYATNATGAWVKTIVDNTGDVGEYPSIAVSGEKVHISYYDATNTALKYANKRRRRVGEDQG